MIVCTDTTGEGKEVCSCAVCEGYKMKLFYCLYVSLFIEDLL